MTFESSGVSFVQPWGRLMQPDGPVGTISQVLATHGMGAFDLNLQSVRRLVELLSKVIVLCFEIIILMREAQACFVTGLVWGI